MHSAPPTFETERLHFRRPVTEDAEAIFTRWASDPDATRYLSWSTHQCLSDSRVFVAWSQEEWTRRPAGPYLIEDRRAGRILGSTGLSYEAPDQVATGYVLARDAWGQGYASEALRAMVALGAALGLEALHAICHIDHVVSRRVLEKGGFTHEGVWRRHGYFPNIHPTERLDVHAFVRRLNAS